MPTERERIGTLVRAARQGRGLSQAELAAAVKLTQPHIAQIESGARGVSVQAAPRFAQALGVDAALLSDRQREAS